MAVVAPDEELELLEDELEDEELELELEEDVLELLELDEEALLDELLVSVFEPPQAVRTRKRPAITSIFIVCTYRFCYALCVSVIRAGWK